MEAFLKAVLTFLGADYNYVFPAVQLENGYFSLPSSPFAPCSQPQFSKHAQAHSNKQETNLIMLAGGLGGSDF